MVLGSKRPFPCTAPGPELPAFLLPCCFYKSFPSIFHIQTLMPLWCQSFCSLKVSFGVPLNVKTVKDILHIPYLQRTCCADHLPGATQKPWGEPAADASTGLLISPVRTHWRFYHQRQNWKSMPLSGVCLMSWPTGLPHQEKSQGRPPLHNNKTLSRHFLWIRHRTKMFFKWHLI